MAYDDNRLIGNGGDLPWRIPEDLKKFKELTSGNIIIMGRKTYESIGKPLPNRINMVVTRNKNYSAEGVFIFNSIEAALRKASVFHKEIFFIGGGAIYNEILSLVDTMYISHIKGSYNGDTYFPEVDFTKWKVESKEEYEKFDFIKYVKAQCIE